MIAHKPVYLLILYPVLFIAMVFVCIQLSFTFYFDRKIKNELQEEVLKQTKGEYEVKIDKLSINILNQSIYISDFLLNPVQDINPGAPKFFASASKINFSHFKLLSFLFRKDLTISGMELVNPLGGFYRSSETYARLHKDSTSKFSIYSLFSKHFHSLRIIKTEISNADLKLYDNYRDTVPSIVSKNTELKISNLCINKNSEEAGRLFLADKFGLVMNRFSYSTKDGLYSFLVKQLTASYIDSTLLLDSLQVVPNYSKEKFSDKAGKQTDRVKISASKVNFSKMDVALFFESNWFIAGELKIDSFNISVYRDLNDKRRVVKPKTLQQILKSIPIYTAIDSIKIKDADISYEEVALGASKPGRVTFNAVNAIVTGFTSDSTLFSKYSTLQMNATCKFMNKGSLEAHYSFPLNTDKMVFDCSGELRTMPLQAMNPMTEPNSNVSIKDGTVESSDIFLSCQRICRKR